MAETLKQWRFNYKRGPAPLSAVVEGKDEDEGYRVAVRWCEQQGCRAPAKVFPVVVAGPEILEQVKVEPEVVLVPEPGTRPTVMERVATVLKG